MDRTTVAVCIGGEAGQGIATIGQVLGKALVRNGYALHVTQTYESRVRGGHNTFALRAGNNIAHAPSEDIDLLIALDAASFQHLPELTPQSLIVCDRAVADLAASAPLPPEARLLRVPVKELGQHENTVMLGIAGKLLGLNKQDLSAALAHFLGKQPAAVLAENEAALDKAFAWPDAQGASFAPLTAPVLPKNANIMVHGNEAAALGAMAGGLKFCAFYPMSPSTSVPLTVAAAATRMGIVLEQVEDEIAAVNMAMGASYAGAPAMAATSGGGLALMSEGVSLAGISETPLVLVIAMRPGPATGLATRTEQGDLELALHSGHGEFPRAILAPGTLDQCFDLTRRAFLLAEEYQIPAFVLTDQYLADSYRESAPFDLGGPSVVLPRPSDDTAYERYAITESGVSPRLLPGAGKALVVCDSHEHTPNGHITENLPLRAKMQEKRMAKLQGLIRDAVAPNFSAPRGGCDPRGGRDWCEPEIFDAPADTLLVCWGSTLGAVREAAAMLHDAGERAEVCHFSQVWPLRPDDFLPRFQAARRVIMVEGNSTGQMAGLIRRETGFAVHGKVLRYDGLPVTARYILERIKEGRHA